MELLWLASLLWTREAWSFCLGLDLLVSITDRRKLKPCIEFKIRDNKDHEVFSILAAVELLPSTQSVQLASTHFSGLPIVFLEIDVKHPSTLHVARQHSLLNTYLAVEEYASHPS